MIEKTFRLSNGFWHKFIPNTNKLLSPQNIKIEVWDLSKRKKITKFHPNIFCVHNCVLNCNGDKLLFVGGCMYNESKFKILDTNNFESLGEFCINEESESAVFINDNTICFGTWDGNLYSYNFNDKRLEKLFSLENSMMHSIVENSNIIYLTINPKEIENKENYIVSYNINTKERSIINLPINKHNKISCLSIFNEKLAILTETYAGEENGSVVHNAELYLFDIEKKELEKIKTDFKIRDVYSNLDAISWSKGKLSVIGLDEVYIIENGKERSIKFERATSVNFSPDGNALAIGGNKAKVIKIEK